MKLFFATFIFTVVFGVFVQSNYSPSNPFPRNWPVPEPAPNPPQNPCHSMSKCN